jgi:hypothetical protein
MRDLSELSAQTLFMYRANSAKTGMSCLGHGKTERNDYMFKAYSKELQSRGYACGDDWDARVRAADSGIFNGEGSE